MQEESDEKRLVNLARAAERLGVAPNTVKAYVSRGELLVVIVGKRLFFEAEDIELFIVARKSKPVEKLKDQEAAEKAIRRESIGRKSETDRSIEGLDLLSRSLKPKKNNDTKRSRRKAKAK